MAVRLEPQDEYLHELGPEETFNESMYFNVFDPAARLGGFFRLANRANEGRGEMTVCDIDLRVGGSWRYALRPDDGDEFAFYGEFLEIVPNERIVQTETFAPFPHEASTNTMTLTERDGVTLLRTLVQHQTAQARDMHINSGMEAGMQDAFDRLEQVAISLA